MNTENNRLIREFLGTDEITASIPFTYYLGEELPTSGNICTLDNVDDEIRLEIEEGTINEVDVSIEILEYHNDWNLLMTVVEKIESLNFFVHILGGACFIETNDLDILELNNWENVISTSTDLIDYEVEMPSKLYATYKAVVYFIKWYNQQQKQ